MSEERALLEASVERLFGDWSARRNASTARGTLDTALQARVDELGLGALLVSESEGGAGGGFEDARVVARAVGRHALPLPLCETLLAARMLAAAGIERPSGGLSVASRVEGRLREDGRYARFTGVLEGVPWGASSSGIAAVLPAAGGARLALLLPAAAISIEAGQNLAEEPRDRLRFADAPVEVGSEPRSTSAGDCGAQLFDFAALLRTGQISGALEAALERSVAYASQRRQFGKTLSQFQAVQQQLALMGEEVLAVDCAAAAAFRAADRGEASFEIACARLRANHAIDVAAATAHQVHGAIGFTREQDLRLFTQRLLAWRSELGNDRFWSDRLGRAVAARGADAFWSDLTARSDRLDGPQPPR
jgi:acyl-CoA dehydrogenase